MSFSATDAAFEGFRLVRRRPAVIIWWTLAYLLMFGVPVVLAAPAIATFMASTEALQAGGEPSMADIQALAGTYMAFVGWFLIPCVVVGTMLNAAVARAVLQPARSAFGYLRLGMDEVRVFVVSLVLGIVMAVVFAVLFLGAGMVAGFATQSGNGWLWLLFAAVVLAIIAVFIVLAVRLSLAIPITVAERRIAIFDSWGVTRGRFWPILGMAFLAFILTIVVSVLSSIVSMPITMITGGLANLADLEGESLQAILAATWPGILAWCVVNALFSALQLAVLYAPFSAAYAQIKGVPAVEA